MAFTKGQAKLANSGRKKGTPNKKTSELLKILGSFNPAKELKEIFKNTEDDALKAKICLYLLSYIYPKRKAIEIDTENIKLPEIKIKGI